MNPLEEVMALEEAVERWGKSTGSLRQACIESQACRDLKSE